MAKKTDKTELKKGRATFNLIGEVKINDYTFKLDEQSQNSDWVYNAMNLGVNCGNGNIVYAEMMGGYGSERDNVVYVHGVKENESGKMIDDYDNRFTIDWDDRLDEDMFELIGDNCFITIGIEKDIKDKTVTKKFLSAYDAIEYLSEHLEDGMVVNVKGNLKYSEYDGKVQVKKEITSIFLSKADSEDKYKATFTQTVLADVNSIGKLDKEKASFPIDAYVVDYVGKIDGKQIKKNVAFTKTFELEVDKEKPENTKKLLNKLFKPEKKNYLVEVTVEGDLIEGQSIVDITEDDIPEDIKDLIDMGAYTLEEAMAKCAGAVGGNSREKRMIIRKPSITYVGKDDDRKPVISIDKQKYLESDLVFLAQLLNNEEDEKDTSVEFNEKEDKEDEDELDWMNALDDLE
jgi:hypothetical protein